ncbi:MAG: AsmA family protein, partial [Opitutaceae bacterium]|nr:AsmA family protein [Verrucomicrobiales bacterium]
MATTSMMPLRKKIMIAFAILIGLLIAVYFTVSSTAFVKKFVLPRVGQSMHAAVTIGDASISPFSYVELKQLKVVPDGEEPLIEVEEVRLRYSLFSILRGHIEVSEISLSGATVNLVQKPDGTSNLDPLLKTSTTPSAGSSSGSQPSINIRNVAIRNATVRRVNILASGRREVSEVSGVNVTLDQLANGQPGKLAVTADLKNESVAPAGLIQAKADGKYEFTLDPTLGPKNVKGRLRVDITKAEGAYNPFASLAAILDCDLNTTDVRDLSLRFEQAGRALGRVTVTGPFETARREGRLKVQIPGIDRQVLNLVGAASGIDFATTVISSTNTVDIMAKGSQINAVGQLQASQFSLKKNGQTSTPSDLKIGYAIIINQTEGSALLRNLTITGARTQTTWLQGSLTKPMTVVPGKSPVTANDSTFDLTVTSLDLADWKGFLGNSVSGGKLGLTLNAASVNGGKQIKLNVNSAVTDLAVTLKDHPLTQARLDFASQMQVDELKKLTVNSYKVDLTQQGKPALKAAGNALFDSRAGSVYLLANIDAIASQLFGSGPSTMLTSGIRFDGIMKDDQFTLKDLEVTLNPTERAPKNELHLSGKFDLSNPNFTKGGIDLKADSLDLTQLYDLFTAQSPTAAKPGSTSPAKSNGNVEPDPVFLPLKEFTANVAVNRLFLHEIAISNWTAKTTIDG